MENIDNFNDIFNTNNRYCALIIDTSISLEHIRISLSHHFLLLKLRTHFLNLLFYIMEK